MLPQDQFDKDNSKAINSASNHFESNRMIESGEEYVQSCRKCLTNEIDAKYNIFNEQNLVKEPLSSKVKKTAAVAGAAVAEGVLLSLPAVVVLPAAAYIIAPVFALVVAYRGVNYMKRPINQVRLKVMKWMPSWMAYKVILWVSVFWFCQNFRSILTLVSGKRERRIALVVEADDLNCCMQSSDLLTVNEFRSRYGTVFQLTFVFYSYCILIQCPEF